MVWSFRRSCKDAFLFLNPCLLKNIASFAISLITEDVLLRVEGPV